MGPPPPDRGGLATLLLVMFVAGFSLVTWKWQEAARAAEADRVAKQHADRAAEEATKRADAEAIAKQHADRAATEATKHTAAERQANKTIRRTLERSRQFGFTAQLRAPPA